LAQKPARKQEIQAYDATSPERPQGSRWVTMSNALARAAHGLTLAEKRIVMIGISRLDSTKPLPFGHVPTTRISAAEYAELAECEPQTAYEALKEAARTFFERKITFYEPAFRRGGKPLNKQTMTQMRWVGSAKYHEGEGWVELGWFPQLLPHLVDLKKQFTSYKLKQTSALRSVYSWKLLELLTRFESTGRAEYTIEDFATSMEATEKQRENFAAIRRKIIEPAVKELTEKDGWLIDWQPVKAGRRVKALRFQFKRDPQGRLL
jgi:plasmid replication initiation protein